MRAPLAAMTWLLALAATSAQASIDCRLLGASLDFGVVEAGRQSEEVAVGYIEIACAGDDESVRLRIGLARPRTLDGLQLGLYADAAHQQPWGDDSGTGNALETRLPTDGRPVRIPVFGRLLAAGDAPQGMSRIPVDVRIDALAEDIGSPNR